MNENMASILNKLVFIHDQINDHRMKFQKTCCNYFEEPCLKAQKDAHIYWGLYANMDKELSLVLHRLDTAFLALQRKSEDEETILRDVSHICFLIESRLKFVSIGTRALLNFLSSLSSKETEDQKVAKDCLLELQGAMSKYRKKISDIEQTLESKHRKVIKSKCLDVSDKELDYISRLANDCLGQANDLDSMMGDLHSHLEVERFKIEEYEGKGSCKEKLFLQNEESIYTCAAYEANCLCIDLLKTFEKMKRTLNLKNKDDLPGYLREALYACVTANNRACGADVQLKNLHKRFQDNETISNLCKRSIDKISVLTAWTAVVKTGIEKLLNK